MQTVFDGKWRSVDGRPLHAATVALSELHNSVVADHLTRALGVEWERRERSADRNPVWAIATAPKELVTEFSSRSRHIDIEKDRLIAEIDAYEAHGRVIGGEAERMADAAHAAWRRDRAAGLASILIAETGDSATASNRRARADLVLAGDIDASAEVALHDGTAPAASRPPLSRPGKSARSFETR